MQSQAAVSKVRKPLTSARTRAKRWREIITIDIETFSAADLKACGLYRYCADPTFQIILFAFKYKSSGKVICIDLLSGERLPKQLLADLTDATVLKRAHNAQFERVCIGRHLGVQLDPAQWQCTLVKCASLGLPRSLAHAANALKLTEGKDTKGKRLINLFCKPRKIPPEPKVPWIFESDLFDNKQTFVKGKRVKKKCIADRYFRDRNLPADLPEEWDEFKRYNIQDVVVEDAIDEALEFFEIPEQEHRLWQLDQKINDRGIRVDMQFVNNAVEMYETYKDDLLNEAMDITGLKNPNSLAQLKKWLSDELDEDIDKLDKDTLGELIKAVDDEQVRRVLQIRQETSKSSISKYSSIQRAVTQDEIVRGLLQFYGADTGRWSSKLIQVHNLLKNMDDFDLDFARKLVKEGNIMVIELFFGSMSMVLSQCIRTAFVPKKGHKLIATDFAQVESRVLAWVAGEKWKLDAFARGIDLYKVMGSKMFNMPVEAIIGDWRQKSKIAELACGFGGGEAAVARMWPKHLPMPSLTERLEIRDNYRKANPRIKQLWREVEDAALDAVRYPGEVFEAGRCKYYMKKDFLMCELPSGRCIVYCRPRIVDGMYGDALECYTVGSNYQWQSNSLYGGLLVENLVQGIARDLLGEKMIELDDMGEDICFHVHDENIIDAPILGVDKRGKLINMVMCEAVEWAPGLPIGAKTDILDYYKKD